MSGRSAYVRKKITQTKAAERAAAGGAGGSSGGGSSNRARSTTSSDDTGTINSDYAQPIRQDTGIGTTNARLLKFAEPIRENEPLQLHGLGPHIGGSQSGGSGSFDGRRDLGGGVTPLPMQRPLDDFAYARARRPNIRTEDVSGIEKSGLRSAVDRKSEGVRRGLAKAFAFGKKNKNDEREQQQQQQQQHPRPQSSATLRPPVFGGEGGSDMDGSAMDAYDMAEAQHYMQRQQLLLQQQQQQQQLAAAAAAGGGSDWDITGGSLLAPPPSSKLPPLPLVTANMPPIKRWIGAGRPVQRWNKLRKDPELWDPNGDVLVFFGHKGQQPRPNPSFRLSSHIIEATESRYLITLLREGSTEDELLQMQLPPSPAGGGPYQRPHHHLHQQNNNHHLHPQQQQQHHGHHLGPHGRLHGGGGIGQMTPPVSEDASLVEADGQISYEMHFPTPSNMSKLDQLRHHITTRNVFALLYHASLVGLSLFQALADLHERLESYMPPDSDNVGTIINYLGARGIDDIRNDPEGAVALLAWSEGPSVRWEEGWRESFLHCAGMYGSLEATADFKNVTPITRALLERACLETQLRVQAAEERLADFHYPDLWPPAVAVTAPASGPVVPSPAKAAADRLQAFLLSHYARVYGRWPPSSAAGSGDPDDDMWLTRTVAQDLQRDFAALYDYLVDRDIVWDGSEARAGRKWMLVSASGNRGFEADTPTLPMTDMLVEFDNKQRFPHIPHPYPLVPESAVPDPASAEAASSNRAGAIERRVQLAYTVATNMLILGSEFHQSDLIDAFSRFEKTDRVGDIDPATARRGRWILLYGILQTLASVSVDAPNMRYRDGVAYHLSPRLKGARMPPWRSMGGGPGDSDEAAHELSHCWTVPRTWHMANVQQQRQQQQQQQHSSSGSSGGHYRHHGASAYSGGGGGNDSSPESGNTSPIQQGGGSSIMTGSSFTDRTDRSSGPSSAPSTAGPGPSGYNFPRPPTNDGYTVRSTSTGGYYTPQGARSVRSSMSIGGPPGGDPHYPLPPPPSASYGMSHRGGGGAPSVVSSGSGAMSEASGNLRLHGSASVRKTGRSKAGGRAGGGGGGGNGGGRMHYGADGANANMMSNSGHNNIAPVNEEADWPVRGAGRMGPTGPLPGTPGTPDAGPLLSSSSSSSGGFFQMMDNSAGGAGGEDSHSNYTGEGSESEKRRQQRRRTKRTGDGGAGHRSKGERPLLSVGDDEPGSVAPMIRDFDALDVVDDHDP